MILHYLWFVFFGVSLLSALYRCVYLGQTQIFEQMVNAMFTSASAAVTIAIGIIGVMTLFMGFMEIGKRSGVINIMSRWGYPLLVRLFPNIPKGHPVFAEMMMNFSANFLGLDNAATPFGLKAMDSLQKRNPQPDRASDEQITFVALHASGLTLIPTSILAQRVILGSKEPTSIFLPTLLITVICLLSVVVLVAIKQKLRLFSRGFLYILLGVGALFIPLFFLSHHGFERVSSVGANVFILLIFFVFMALAFRKKINMYNSFIDGAKEGFATSVRLIPYLVGMLVMIAVLRASGAFDSFFLLINAAVHATGLPTEWTQALPVGLLKPFSGSGARALMIDTMRTHGADSFVGKLSCIFQGSSDTTFYITSLYFGAVGVRNVRYTLGVCLLADLVSIICAVYVAYILF